MPFKVGFVSGAVLLGSFALSAIHPWGNQRAGVKPQAQLLQNSNVPEGVRQVIEKKCGDCHSDNPHYPVYSRFAPVSWVIERDVHQGRGVLDLSRWQDYPADSRADLLSRIASEARSQGMPPEPYLLLHPGNRLSAEEEQQVYDWAKSERRHIREQLKASAQPVTHARTTRP